LINIRKLGKKERRKERFQKERKRNVEFGKKRE
jgi:hypothetical protein